MATTQTKNDDLDLLKAFAQDGRKRGLTGEAILTEAIRTGLLRHTPCPECEGEGCKRCDGHGFGFLMGERGKA